MTWDESIWIDFLCRTKYMDGMASQDGFGMLPAEQDTQVAWHPRMGLRCYLPDISVWIQATPGSMLTHFLIFMFIKHFYHNLIYITYWFESCLPVCLCPCGCCKGQFLAPVQRHADSPDNFKLTVLVQPALLSWSVCTGTASSFETDFLNASSTDTYFRCAREVRLEWLQQGCSTSKFRHVQYESDEKRAVKSMQVVTMSNNF